MKRSIGKRTIWFFAATLTVLIIACMVLSYRNAYSDEIDLNRSYGRSAAYITGEILNSADLNELQKPESRATYEMVRRELRMVCKSQSLAYLYVYTVDEQGIRHYVVTVAADDELNKAAEAELGLGAISKEPILGPERAALRGETSDETYILNNRYGRMVSWVTPYFDGNGKVAALIGTDVSIEVQNSAIVKQFLILLLPITGIMIAAFLILYLLLQIRLIRPLHVVAERMEQFDPEANEMPLQIHSQDEIQQIADAFEKMSSEIRAYIGNIEEITKQQEYERAQLDVARRIQYGMVPASFHDCRDGMDVCGLMRPAKEVGGDFYDCFLRPDGQYCALIADVSGKGVAGALFMALTKNLVRERIMRFADPADALNSANDDLCKQNPEGMFVTLFAMLIDPKTGTVRFANAGHNPPVLLKNGTAQYLNPKRGIALGLFPDADVETETMTLAPDDGILLYTDGVTEAVSKERTFYGTERLLALLQSLGQTDSRIAVKAVEESVDRFFCGCEQFDDITVVAARFTGAEVRKAVPLTLEAFEQVKREILAESAGSANAKKIVLACEEAFVNIVRYANASEADWRIKREGDSLTVELRDNGTRFDPFSQSLKEDDDFLSMDEGGLGIRFIRSIASDTNWTYTDGRNVLTLVFKV